jgi:hypothetical protein
MLHVLAHFAVLPDPRAANAKRAYEKGMQVTPKMMVSAWARMTLAARPVEKGDETSAAIAMLANLELQGCDHYR